ncbi:hypothetical protein [uncultured Duncaniella sp.]|uniref:hypothetical protein n=1 Tax=uncultured Duncaniella sp. TaxID=2768039 RepID=UPI0026041F56|nr:hypothetical protein [uncultured Duncaniella sp.]
MPITIEEGGILVKDSDISTLVGGISTDLPDAVRRTLSNSVKSLSAELDATRMNRSAKTTRDGRQSTMSTNSFVTDTEAFTTISEMINGNQKDFAGFGTMLDSLYAKNKKYFTIIKDYEIMPILIPQINRVLDFLVNECISPDVQNEQTFVIKYTGTDATGGVQADIDAIKHEMKLDALLREVYINRYKLGREYYAVEDYNRTFDRMLQMMERKRMNEAAGVIKEVSDFDYISQTCAGLVGRIGDLTVKCPIQAIAESANGSAREKKPIIETTEFSFTLKDLNIVVERSPVVSMLEDAQAEMLSESYSRFSSDKLFESLDMLNEASAPIDNTKFEAIVTNMRKKKLQRCMIKRFDPAKVFKLKIGGKVIGFFYVTDINEGTASMVNFAQSLKDQLMKTRATNLSAATQSVEDVISKELAQRIINTFDPNIGITRVEDIDLMHDFIQNNEIYKGNKRITFYYADEIYDMSRTGDSILTNAVFFTKLYSTLLLNNIITKVLRGRGRQIHTVKIGASPNVQRYLDNAMAALAMPETHLGTLHGSFEQIMNPFNGASDIVIPTDEDDAQYIRTDYIPGQDVDMNDEFLRTLLNSIVTSFGLDSAVIDATNGNLQFARTLSMESLQICNAVRNEQQDLFDSWEAMCLAVLRIMGSEATVAALDNGQIDIKFFEPKSLIIQNLIDDINNVKSLAENIADIIPRYNIEGTENERTKFIYEVVKERTNLDFGDFEDIVENAKITNIDDALLTKIAELIREYMENTQEHQYGDTTGDGLADNGAGEATEDAYTGEGDESELTPEEQEIADMSDETDTEEDEDL